MSPQISIPELERELHDYLPEGLRQVYEPLFKDTVWLTSKWAEYCKLYGEQKEIVELLNRHAGYLFVIIQDTLWDDILLHITRLIAPIKSNGKSNLTIRMLSERIPDRDLRKIIDKLVEKCIEAGSFASDHRNKRLAHTDRDLALSSERLPGNSRKQIKQFVDLLHDLIRTIYQHYTGVHYDLGMCHMSDDAYALISSLRRAEASAL